MGSQHYTVPLSISHRPLLIEGVPRSKHPLSSIGLYRQLKATFPYLIEALSHVK
jgi:hypothetical protein